MVLNQTAGCSICRVDCEPARQTATFEVSRVILKGIIASTRNPLKFRGVKEETVMSRDVRSALSSILVAAIMGAAAIPGPAQTPPPRSRPGAPPPHRAAAGAAAGDAVPARLWLRLRRRLQRRRRPLQCRNAARSRIQPGLSRPRKELRPAIRQFRRVSRRVQSRPRIRLYG